MFLKISEFKKAMKSALKTSGGLIIGNVKGHFLVHTSLWGVWVESVYATSKFKAAIVELIGDMPEEETCYRYHLEEKNLKMEYQIRYENPYDQWKEAKDFACEVPLAFTVRLMSCPFTRVKVTGLILLCCNPMQQG